MKVIYAFLMFALAFMAVKAELNCCAYRPYEGYTQDSCPNVCVWHSYECPTSSFCEVQKYAKRDCYEPDQCVWRDDYYYYARNVKATEN